MASRRCGTSLSSGGDSCRCVGPPTPSTCRYRPRSCCTRRGPRSRNGDRPMTDVQAGHVEVRAPFTGTVLSVAVAAECRVASGDELLVIEAMKMEPLVRAQTAGLVRSVPVTVDATVAEGTVLVVLAPSGSQAASVAAAAEVPPDHIRADLAEARERHRTGLDEGRPEATGRGPGGGR